MSNESVPPEVLARFDDARVRFRWAGTHVPKLNEVLGELIDASAWKIEKEDGLPEGMVRLRIHSQPPAEIGLIIGDIVHSLRSSLDYATCALLRIADEKADLKWVQFPFGRRGKPLNSAERSKISALAQYGIPHIEAARNKAGEGLEILNLVSNQDKHRLIVATLLRRMPIKFEIDQETNTGSIVPDLDKADVWNTPISDGDIIEMGLGVSLRPGFTIDGVAYAFSMIVVQQLFAAVDLTIAYMIKAGEFEMIEKMASSH